MAMQTTGASRLKQSLDHLKNHIKYPANRAALVKACSGMPDHTPEDQSWFNSNLPEGTYKTPGDVINALFTKV